MSGNGNGISTFDQRRLFVEGVRVVHPTYGAGVVKAARFHSARTSRTTRTIVCRVFVLFDATVGGLRRVEVDGRDLVLERGSGDE